MQFWTRCASKTKTGCEGPADFVLIHSIYNVISQHKHKIGTLLDEETKNKTDLSEVSRITDNANQNMDITLYYHLYLSPALSYYPQ